MLSCSRACCSICAVWRVPNEFLVRFAADGNLNVDLRGPVHRDDSSDMDGMFLPVLSYWLGIRLPDWQPLRLCHCFGRDGMCPGKREAETFSFLLSQFLRACLDDGPERITEFASVFTVEVVDAPELRRRFGTSAIFHAKHSSTFRRRDCAMIAQKPRGIRRTTPTNRCWTGTN